MRLTEQDIDAIDAYLAGQLSGEELMSFELRLAGDAAFADEVGMMEALAVGAKRSVLEEKMRMLQSVDSDQLVVDSESVDSGQLIVDSEAVVEEGASMDYGPSTKDSKSKVRGLWKVLAVAASVGVLGILFFMQIENDELQIIPFPDMMTVRSVEVDQLNEGMSAYTNGDFNKALLEFNKIDGEISVNDISFYKSICALMLGQYSDAQEYLSDADSEKYPIAYYQGMIDLKRGKEIVDLEMFCECENCPPFLLSEITKYCLK